MKPTPFNPETDLPPVPFEEKHFRLATALKEQGLSWKPHVGCFVRDPGGFIQAASPFPGRVYFILNLGHFLKIFGSVEEITKKLLWLPTWHQALLVCRELGVREGDVREGRSKMGEFQPGDELLAVYELILKRLEEGARRKD